MISAVRPVLSDDAVERAVALRMTRQQILERDQDLPFGQEHEPHLWTIIDESALIRVAGTPDILKAQLAHIVMMAQRPNITIQVILNRDGINCAFGRAFAVLVLRNASSLVYLEDIGTARYVRDRDEVSRYTLIFEGYSRDHQQSVDQALTSGHVAHDA